MTSAKADYHLRWHCGWCPQESDGSREAAGRRRLGRHQPGESGVLRRSGSGKGRRKRKRSRTPRSAPLAAANASVFVYGDSLVAQAEPYLVVVGKALGLTITSRAFDGTAPCDFLGKFRDDLAAKRVDEAVWAFSGNSIGSCMLDRLGHPLVGAALLAQYRTDTEAAITASETAKVSFVLASPPAPRSTGDGWQQLDAVYREVAAAHPRVQYADAGAAIAPNGQFLPTQRCLPFED